MIQLIELIGAILVLVVARKLIYADSQRVFVDRAARKGCLVRGRLVQSYTEGETVHITYEYTVDGSTYQISVENYEDGCDENPPQTTAIYYKGTNPAKAMVRERNERKKVRNNIKYHLVFSFVLFLVTGIVYVLNL